MMCAGCGVELCGAYDQSGHSPVPLVLTRVTIRPARTRRKEVEMKRIRRWRYYCDFCKKSGGSGGPMTRHEKYCTANPDRKCRMCERVELEQQPVDKLIEALKSEGEDYKKGVKALADLSEGCPACMLAAIRQSGIQKPATEENDWEYVHIPFDYKEAKEQFWQDIRDAEFREDQYSYCY